MYISSDVVFEDQNIVVQWTVYRYNDDAIAEIQRAGGYDGGFQSGTSSAPAAPASQEHLRGTLRRP